MLSSHASAEHIPFTGEPTALYVRRERKDRNRVANVFDGNGQKVFTIERKTMLSHIWSVLEFPSRREIATIFTGLARRYVDFHNKKG